MLATGDSIVKYATFKPSITSYPEAMKDCTTSNKETFGAVSFLIRSPQLVETWYREMKVSHIARRSFMTRKVNSSKISTWEEREHNSEHGYIELFKSIRLIDRFNEVSILNLS